MKLGIFETVISGCMRSFDLDYPANDCDLSKWARFIASFLSIAEVICLWRAFLDECV